MKIPPNYYDFIKKLHPIVIDLAEKDAEELMAGINPPTAIYSVDDYASRYAQCFEYVKESIEKSVGLSFDDIKQHLGYAERVQVGLLFENINQEYHSIVNFALSGKKSFYFHNNLAEHLAHTEVNLKAALVELPFPTCQFVFTAPAVINAMHNIRGKEGRRAMNTYDLDYSAPVSIFLTMHPATPEFPYRKLLMVAWHARLPNNGYLCIKRELCMREDWTLEQALRTDWQELTPDNLGSGLSLNVHKGHVERSDDKDFYTDGLLFFRIVLNAILYLSSDQAETQLAHTPRAALEARAEAVLSIPKRKKILREARQYSELDCMEVGASVGSIIIQKMQEGPGSENHGGGKPVVRFMVRGHWRNQAFGAGRTDRKLIWIKPFYKGPDVATVINKPYLVK